MERDATASDGVLFECNNFVFFWVRGGEGIIPCSSTSVETRGSLLLLSMPINFTFGK